VTMMQRANGHKRMGGPIMNYWNMRAPVWDKQQVLVFLWFFMLFFKRTPKNTKNNSWGFF
jgi:hypothetical protein